MSEQKKEIWKKVKGYKGAYEVSTNGRVRNKEGRILSTYKRSGYTYLKLSKNGERKEWSSHRLVATTFKSNRKNKPVVNHKDGNRSNNTLDNLEWATFSENSKHAYKTGLQKAKRGEDSPSSVLSKEQVISMRALYKLGHFSYKTLGELFGVTRTCASNAIKGKTWKTLKVVQ